MKDCHAEVTDYDHHYAGALRSGEDRLTALDSPLARPCSEETYKLEILRVIGVVESLWRVLRQQSPRSQKYYYYCGESADTVGKTGLLVEIGQLAI